MAFVSCLLMLQELQVELFDFLFFFFCVLCSLYVELAKSKFVLSKYVKCCLKLRIICIPSGVCV